MMSSMITKRADHLLIAGMIDPNSRVLDVGCSDGGLLQLLAEQKNVDARGVELSQEGVNKCVANGLSVVQGDADRDLDIYPDAAFDYAVLSQTIQATQNPRHVLEQLLRISRHTIVSFPNFGHWRVRWSLGVRGRMPVTENLTYSWYETPNIHFCTIRDFSALVEEIGATIDDQIALDSRGTKLGASATGRFANLMAEQAVFLLRK